MTRFVFTESFLLTLSIHEGALQGLWSYCRALIRMHMVSNCCQRPSWPIMWTVPVFGYLLKTQNYCLCPNGRYTPPLVAHSPPYTHHRGGWICYNTLASYKTTGVNLAWLQRGIRERQ